MISILELRRMLAEHPTVRSADGDKIGTLKRAFLDDETGRPTFVTISGGLLAGAEYVVPAEDVTLLEDGVHVDFAKEVVTDAPVVEIERNLGPDVEDELYLWYAAHGGPRGTEDVDPG